MDQVARAIYAKPKAANFGGPVTLANDMSQPTLSPTRGSSPSMKTIKGMSREEKIKMLD